MPIIRAEGVSIRYITGDFKDIGLKEYVLRKLTGNYQVKEFWADWDVTFELEKGDMLGIVGTNGAGKSTLLKAISGIMVPTRGKIQTNGTVAALLELTSGFDGDLTVRENTYLRGALLGYTRAFMDQMYDEIISFAVVFPTEPVIPMTGIQSVFLYPSASRAMAFAVLSTTIRQPCASGISRSTMQHAAPSSNALPT